MIRFLYITQSVAHLGTGQRDVPHEVPHSLPTAKPEPSLLFGVCTSPKKAYRARVDAQMKTWMSGLKSEEVLIVGAEAPEGLSGRFSWESAPECTDNHDGESCKERNLLKFAWMRDVEWVWILNDDHYAFPTAVKQALHAYDPNTPVILGTPGCGTKVCYGMCGGAGELVSRGALKRMFENGRDIFDQEYKASIVKCDYWGDVATGDVAKHHRVPLQSIRGVYGWGKLTNETKKIMDAGRDKAKAPLLFHYVSIEQMYEIHSYWTMNAPVVLKRSVGADVLTYEAAYDAEVAEYVRYANSCVYSKEDGGTQKLRPECSRARFMHFVS